MIYIHGGGFVGGEANDLVYGPDFLLTEDNIVITVQYRLGIFGFLNLGFAEYTGSMGLKDQQVAIKWIYENIVNFGGNKDEILLFGESAGGTSVHLHMLNAESRKYFTRVYMISCTAFSYFTFNTTNHLQRMQKFADIDDVNELIGYLKTTKSDVLANCHTFDDFGMTLTVPWSPTIETSDTIGAFMTEFPEVIYKSGNAPMMDTLISFNSKEYVSFYPDLLEIEYPLIRDGLKEEIRLPFGDLNENTHPEEYKQSLAKLKKAYFSKNNNKNAIKEANIGLISDLNFIYSVLKATSYQASVNNNGSDESLHKNTFLFRFAFSFDLNAFKLRENMEFDGAGHGEDLCYMFHCHILDILGFYDKHFEQKDEAYNGMMRMAKIITNFARTGDPSIEGDTPFRSCKSPTEIFCQEITNNPKSSVTSDIMEQIHYDTWREIEDSHEKLTQSNNGPVKGIALTSALHQKYHAFKGVPYAEPPTTGTDPYTGEDVDRRFKAPEPLKRHWSDSIIVNEYKNRCIPSTKMFQDSSTTSEDCLYLNIYVPAGGAEKKTTLVWIHGGGFVNGDATDLMYGPDFLISEDIILVTLTYRIGIFGFLNLGFGEYTGNMGLKDQQLALKWIYENIEFFYGNKDEILLMGESAGAISVNFHMLNEESRKYFKRVYVGSGSVFNFWTLSKTNNTNNSDNVPNFDALFAFNSHEYLTFMPSVASKSEPLLTENLEESKLLLPFDNLNENTHPEEYKQALEVLRKAYFPNPDDNEAVKDGNMGLLSEMSFGYGILKALTLQIRANNAAQKNTFLFRFSMDTDLNVIKEMTQADFVGAGHGEDLFYIFHCGIFARKCKKHLKQKDAVYDSITRMVKMITNFAKTGNPSLENDTPFKPCESPTEIFCQEISVKQKSATTTNIMETLHFNTWQEIEELNDRISQND